MRIAHLSDLHLGFRAFSRVDRGWNLRERDVAGVFRRAVQEVVSLEPDLVLVAGDLFDHPDPPSTAVLALLRGFDALRRSLPRTPILVIAGERDSPLNPADPGPVAALDSLPGVEAAAGAARAVRLREAGVHVLLVPHRAVVRTPFPDLRPDPGARWNILLIRGDPSRVAGGVKVDASRWDYVAVGGEHVARRLRDGVWCAGSLERVGSDPWREATEEKGFVLYDLEEGRGEMHSVPARPVVDLAPVRTSLRDAEAGTRRLRDVLKGVPGGIEGKILRIRLRGDILAPEEGAAAGLLAAVRARTAHVEFLLLGTGRENPEPPALRTGGKEGVWSLPAGFPELRSGLTVVTGSDPGVRRRAVLGLGAAGPRVTDGSLSPELRRLAWAGARNPSRTLRDGVRLLAALGGGGGEGPDTPEAEASAEPVPSGPPAHEALEEELSRVRADAVEAAGEMEAGNLEWARTRQDAESRLTAYRDRARELRSRIRELERDGEDAPCPTCGRLVGEGFDALLRTLREEWEAVVQDGRWWKKRREQMEEKPEDLRRLEGENWKLQARLESLTERVERERERRRWADRKGEAPADASPAPPDPGPWDFDAEARPVVRRLLRRAGSLAHRLTEGRLGGVVWEEGQVRILEREAPPRDPTPEEVPLLAFSLHLALWDLARETGEAPDAALLGELAGDGDAGVAARAVDLAVRVLPPSAAALLIVPPGAVERRSEAVDALWEVEEVSSALAYHERPSGRPRISLA